MKVLRAAAEAIEQGRRTALVTVTSIGGSTPRTSGARMLVYDNGDIVGTVGGGTFEYRCIEQAIEAIEQRTPRTYAVHLTRDLGMCCGGAMEAFVEPLETQDHLVIYGGGHVGKATADVARDLGFSLTVLDERDEWANEERFPGATIHGVDPRRRLDELPYGGNAYHLIVTHSHQLDQDLLQDLVARPVAWLGLIGSRAKLAKFFVRLRAAGIDESLLKKVSGPVGLDIGAETPEEIAVSIAAELVRVRRRCNRPPLPLSELPLPARGGDGKARAPALGD